MKRNHSSLDKLKSIKVRTAILAVSVLAMPTVVFAQSCGFPENTGVGSGIIPFDMSGLAVSAGSPTASKAVTLPDGRTITVSTQYISGSGFGNFAMTDVRPAVKFMPQFSGNTGLRTTNRNIATSEIRVTFSPAVDVIVGDAETPSAAERSTFSTNGGVWEQIDGTTPDDDQIVTGAETSTLSWIGADARTDNDFSLFVTRNASTIDVRADQNPVGGLTGFFVAFPGSDGGDAAPSYGNAFHALTQYTSCSTYGSNSPFLGSAFGDPDQTGNASASADGDDTAGTSDEDGFITLPAVAVSQTSYTIEGSRISASGSGTLYAWADFDQSGTFDADEFASASVASGSVGDLVFSAAGLSDIAIGQSAIRLRITTDTLTASDANTTFASNGEIEDHPFAVLAAVPPTAEDDLANNPNVGTPTTIDPLADNGNGPDSDGNGSVVPGTVVLTGTGAPLGSVVSNGGKTLTVPGEGVWTVAGDGQITFAPEASFTGNPTPAAYTVNDNDGLTSNEAFVTITYTAAPVATNDVDTTPVTGPVSLNPLGNDSGNVSLDPASVVLTGTGAPSNATLAPDGKSLTVPGEGIWTVAASGLVTFAPEGGFSGTPTPAAYTVADANGTVSNEATIAFGAAPTIAAAADAFAINDAAAGGTTPSVLGNDTLNGSSITDPSDVTLTPGASPVAGMTMNADGTITVGPGVTPGTYSYPYEICDADNPTNCATAVATVVVGAEDLLDEIADDLVNVLEEDRAATVSQLSQQISGYAADAGQRLRNRHSGDGACLANVNAVLDRENILFDTDKAIIKPRSQHVLDEIADVLRSCSGTAFEIAGHTDSDASDAYNLDLSQRRVEAVLRALAARDVDTAGYVARGYGESRPIASNATAAGKAQNRRVEFLPLGGRNLAQAQCEDDKHIRALDASLNNNGGSVDGHFLRDTHDCYGDIRRVYEGTLSYLETDSGTSQTMLNLSYRRERFTDEDSIRGYFLGAYLSNNDVTGVATGDIDGLGVNGGIYGADRLNSGLFLDYYLGGAVGVHDFELAFDALSGPITAEGDYTYYAAFAGAALSGDLEFGEKTVTPRVGIDYVYSPSADVDVTALNGAPVSGALELASLSGGRFFAEVGTAWDVQDGEARLGITPRIACYQSIHGLDGACGFGGSIELSSIGDETGTVYSVELDAEFGDGYDRGALSGSISRTLNLGTVSGSAKLAPEGSMSLGGTYELKF